MCFSASASFGAGIVLSAIGIATIKRVQSPSQIIFASIPFIFAVQQISEGFLWLALSNPAFASLQVVTTYTFLFFARIVWPLWIPLAILMLEKEEKHKKKLQFFAGLGMMVSLFMTYCLMFYPAHAEIIGYHISYIQDYPVSFSIYSGVFYVIATIVPSFLSGVKRMWTFGTTMLVSYIITLIFYEKYIVSVWCFFASVISIVVLVLMQEITISYKKNQHQIA